MFTNNSWTGGLVHKPLVFRTTTSRDGEYTILLHLRLNAMSRVTAALSRTSDIISVVAALVMVAGIVHVIINLRPSPPAQPPNAHDACERKHISSAAFHPIQYDREAQLRKWSSLISPPTPTLTLRHPLSLSDTHSHSHTPSLSHSHYHSHSLLHMHSHTHFHSHSHPHPHPAQPAPPPSPRRPLATNIIYSRRSPTARRPAKIPCPSSVTIITESSSLTPSLTEPSHTSFLSPSPLPSLHSPYLLLSSLS